MKPLSQTQEQSLRDAMNRFIARIMERQAEKLARGTSLPARH